MSATILQMRARFVGARTDQEIARTRVYDRLIAHCPMHRIRAAQDMAANAITSRSASIERAVKGAVAWALYANHEPPSAA